MAHKQFETIAAGLILFMITALLVFVVKPVFFSEGSHVPAAKVGQAVITEERWLEELKSRYGESVLEDMIDAEVVRQMADKYKLRASDTDVERIYWMERISSNPSNEVKADNPQRVKKRIEARILFEELMVRDTVIPEEELRQYYDAEKQQFSIPEAYHIRQILTGSKGEAEQILRELRDGAGFAALAREKSLDRISAANGGDLGYLTERSGLEMDPYLTAAAAMKPDSYKEVKTSGGYAVITLQDKVEPRQYSFTESKGQIRRQLALDQLAVPADAKLFWEEADVRELLKNPSNMIK